MVMKFCLRNLNFPPKVWRILEVLCVVISACVVRTCWGGKMEGKEIWVISGNGHYNYQSVLGEIKNAILILYYFNFSFWSINKWYKSFLCFILSEHEINTTYFFLLGFHPAIRKKMFSSTVSLTYEVNDRAV